MVVSADEELRRYFDQLRQRGLFSLAEHAALSRLDDPLLLPDRRTELVIEYAKTLADHAGYVSPNQQTELLIQADQVLQLEIQRDAKHAPVLEMQRTFLQAYQAELLRWDVVLSPHDAALRSRWLKVVETVLQTLKSQAQTFDELLRDSRRDPEAGNEPFELRQRLALIHWQRGVLLRDRAAETATNDPQRSADLVEAISELMESLSGTVDVEAKVSSQLVLADCTRLQLQPERCREMCDAILKTADELPADLRDGARACRIRSWLDQGQAVTAAQELLTLRQTQHVLSGELWFVQLQTLLAMRDIALKKHDDDLTKTLTSEAELVLQRVREQAGGRWSRYCQQLWERDAALQDYGADLDRWLQSAQGHARSGHRAEAAVAYAEAIALAEQQMRTEMVIDLRYTRGSLLIDMNEFAAAATELQTIVSQAPQHPKAASASLLEAYALGRLYAAERSQPRREAYTEALHQHLERYPQDFTSDDVRYMLAQLEEQRLQLSKALPLYLAISTEHPQSVAATGGALRCYVGLIQRLQQLQRDWQPFQQQARIELTRRVETWKNPPAEWSTEQATIALGLARLQLEALPPDYVAAEDWLQRLQAAVQAPLHQNADWKAIANDALPLQLIAWAGTDQSTRAQQLLFALDGQDHQAWLAVIKGLEPLSQRSDSPHSVDLRKLMREALRRLEPLRGQLSDSAQIDFDLIRVETLLVTGEASQAKAIAESLASRTAQDRVVQQALAESLTRSRQPDIQKIAVTVWRRLESFESPGSLAWLTARAHVIDALGWSGQTAEAEKLLNVTRVLYPSIEDPQLQQQYQELLQRWGQASSPK